MKMEISKIFKREDGSRVQVYVSLTIGYVHRGEPNWRISAYVCEKGKRVFRNTHNIDNYEWRKLNTEDREAHRMAGILKITSEAEILQVKTELWQMLKP